MPERRVILTDAPALPGDVERVEAALAGRPEDSELQGTIREMIQEAIQWSEQNLEPAQTDATDYYMGRKFGNEEEGRSQVVSTDVRDAVQAMLPSLMRIFFGPERAVEYEPRGPEDIAGAEQATDYVNLVVQEDNPGFLIIHSWMKDALVRKLGIVKWWWEDDEKVEQTKYTGLLDPQVQLLESEEDLEVVIESFIEIEGVTEYNVTATRRTDAGQVRIAAIPNDEYIFSPSARSQEEARMVGHIRELRADELIAIGIPEEMVERNSGKGTSGGRGKSGRKATSGGSADLVTARRTAQDSEEEDVQPEETFPIVFAEVYVYIDRDDDGIAELRKFQCVGDNFEIVPDDRGEIDGEIVDDRPFAVLCPDPEPHTLVGLSLADYVMDIQLIKSNIIRGMLDSLNLALNPQTEVVDGQVNMKDLMNPEIGSVVRVRQPGMLRELKHVFVGAEAFPMVQYFDEMKENRTGQSKASQGLDADALQSSTKAAVAATLSAAQQHIEMIARVFAETGFKQLFKGLLKLITQHQDRTRVVRLRNKFVAVDPRSWNAGMDVRVNIALGQGLIEDKLQSLAILMAEQKEQLQAGSPLVSMVEYRKTLGRFVELAGWKNSNEFFKPWTDEQQKEADEAAAQAPPPPDATMLLIQVEQKKVEVQMQKDQAELAFKREEMVLKDDRERDKLARDSALKELELETKYRVQLSDSHLRATVIADRASMDADLKERAAREQAQQAQAQQVQQAQAAAAAQAGPGAQQGGAQ